MSWTQLSSSEPASASFSRLTSIIQWSYNPVIPTSASFCHLNSLIQWVNVSLFLSSQLTHPVSQLRLSSIASTHSSSESTWAPFSLLNSSPCYNRNGWLGVKHQVTYFQSPQLYYPVNQLQSPQLGHRDGLPVLFTTHRSAPSQQEEYLSKRGRRSKHSMETLIREAGF